MSALGELVRVSRPRFWLYLAGPVLVGAAWGAEAIDALAQPLVGGLLAYYSVPANLLLYGVNDIFDAAADALNPKKEGREVRYTGGRYLPLVVALCALLGLLLLVWLPPRARALHALFLALAVGYSAPPLRFKASPVLDSLSNGLYILPGVVAYVALAGHAPPMAAVVGGWLWAMAMHTYSAVPDIAPDRQAGLETTATWLGRRGALVYCGLCWMGAALAFGWVSPWLGLLLAPYPLLLVLTVRREIPIERAYWWYPMLNATVGAVLTVAGLYRMLPDGLPSGLPG